MKMMNRVIGIMILMVMMGTQICSVSAATTRRQKFINALSSMSSTIKADAKAGRVWKYSKTGQVSTSFATARSKNKRVMDCARYVSWALIDAGILAKGQRLYKKAGGKITYTNKNARDRVHKYATVKNVESKYVTVYDLISDGKIKAGDIICYESHMNVYAGNYRFYDGGHSFTNSKGEYRSSLKGRKDQYMYSELVTRTISIKK